MSILVGRDEDFTPAIKKIMDKLENIEQAIIELSDCKCKSLPAPTTPVQPIPKLPQIKKKVK